jgi:hypothetical protein
LLLALLAHTDVVECQEAMGETSRGRSSLMGRASPLLAARLQE